LDHPAIGVRAAALVAREPCPCEACRFRESCAQRLLACAAFSMYVAGESKPRWSTAPRAPTTARYQALLEEKPGRPSA